MSQEKKRSSGTLFGCSIIFLLILALGVIVTFMFWPDNGGIIEASFSKNKVALVRVEGVIMDGREVINQIQDWSEDDSVQAIVLRIVSPGGAVAPSQDIHDAVITAKKQKPVVASFGSVAASGGYYIGVACDKIVTSPGTITGSIGVIMSFNTTYQLMDKIGLGAVVIKSGKFKDTGSPHRDMTEEEKAYFQSVVDSVHGQFTAAVAAGRGLDIETVKQLADGRIYTGAQAKDLKLADELGSLTEAIKLAGSLAGIEGDPIVVEKEDELGIFKKLFGDEFEVRIPNLMSKPAGVYYMWPAAM